MGKESLKNLEEELPIKNIIPWSIANPTVNHQFKKIIY